MGAGDASEMAGGSWRPLPPLPEWEASKVRSAPPIRTSNTAPPRLRRAWCSYQCTLCARSRHMRHPDLRAGWCLLPLTCSMTAGAVAQTRASAPSPEVRTPHQPERLMSTDTLQYRGPGTTSAPADTAAIRPFRVRVPDQALQDLHRRIEATRWPDRELVPDRSQGVQLATLRELARFWTTEHDWRKAEARLNSLPQFVTRIDGVDIHFIHVR